MRSWNIRTGRTATCTLPQTEVPNTQRFEICGDKGKIMIDGSKLTLTTIDGGHPRIHRNQYRNVGQSENGRQAGYDSGGR